MISKEKLFRLFDYDGEYYITVKDGTFVTLGNYASDPQQPYLSYAESERYLKRACFKNDISCIICTKELSSNEILVNSGKGIAIAKSPRSSFNAFHNWFVTNEPDYTNSYEKTVVGEKNIIHNRASIAEYGVKIGSNCIIEENVVIRSGTVIGNNVEIGAGSIIGCPSHIVIQGQDGNLFLVNQVGKLFLHDNVSVGCNTTISKGSFPYETTEIGEYSKVENGVEISHNSKIGKNCIITGQSHICGNVVLGDNIRLNPKSIISNRIKVYDNAVIDLGSVVVNDIKEGVRVAGNFAIEHGKFLLWHKTKLRGQ